MIVLALIVLPFLYLAYRLFVPSEAAQRKAEKWPAVSARIIKMFAPEFKRRSYRWLVVDCEFTDGLGRAPTKYGRGCMVKDLRASSVGDAQNLVGTKVTVRIQPRGSDAFLELRTLGNGAAFTPRRRFAPFMNDSRDSD